ncbi:Ribonuclease Z protein, partial [Marine Group I thaumarchaeote SCGC RSA3]
IFENEKFSIRTCKANHSIVAFSYLFEEKDKPGRFNVEKAKELRIPEGELWNKLQNGNEIKINDKIIRPEDVTFLEDEKQKAQDTCHSTAKQAATLGKNARVKNLILTHFSARYKDEVEHLKEAKEIHDSVITARDLLEIEIK